MFCRLQSKIIFLLDKFLDYCIMFIFFNHYCTQCNNYPSHFFFFFWRNKSKNTRGKESSSNTALYKRWKTSRLTQQKKKKKRGTKNFYKDSYISIWECKQQSGRRCVIWIFYNQINKFIMKWKEQWNLSFSADQWELSFGNLNIINKNILSHF